MLFKDIMKEKFQLIRNHVHMTLQRHNFTIANICYQLWPIFQLSSKSFHKCTNFQFTYGCASWWIWFFRISLLKHYFYLSGNPRKSFLLIACAKLISNSIYSLEHHGECYTISSLLIVLESKISLWNTHHIIKRIRSLVVQFVRSIVC